MSDEAERKNDEQSNQLITIKQQAITNRLSDCNDQDTNKMNAELLAMLGSVPGVSSRRENEPKTLLSFKAGKLIAERQPVSPRSLYPFMH
jgi:hypothetical protein